MVKTILLTGGTGFLGSRLVVRLLEKKYRVIILKRSDSNVFRIKNYLNQVISFDIEKRNLENLFCEYNIDIIIHCATKYGRNQDCPHEVIEANLILPLNLLYLSKKYNVNIFINTDTTFDLRINNYSLSKSQFRQWLEIYAQAMICINIKLSNIYGPFDNDSEFVTYIIRQLLRNSTEIKLTKGEQKRYFVYIDDVVDAYIKIVEYSLINQIGIHHFQVGSQPATSIKNFVQLVQKLLPNNKTKLLFGALSYRKYEVMNPSLNISKLVGLGWRQNISLKEGLKLTIQTEKERILR